jgi:ribosomal-protein-serine acetyltransferase
MQIEDNLRLALISEQYTQAIYDLACANRNYLREWLPWVDNMHDESFTEAFVMRCLKGQEEGISASYVILQNNEIIGTIGLFKIDNQNKSAEIGYWLAEAQQGKSIMRKCCKHLITHCFTTLSLNRIQIRCATENSKSAHIPRALGFTKEGRLRAAEWLNDRFTDLYLFSLLKTDTRAS